MVADFSPNGALVRSVAPSSRTSLADCVRRRLQTGPALNRKGMRVHGAGHQMLRRASQVLPLCPVWTSHRGRSLGKPGPPLLPPQRTCYHAGAGRGTGCRSQSIPRASAHQTSAHRSGQGPNALRQPVMRHRATCPLRAFIGPYDMPIAMAASVALATHEGDRTSCERFRGPCIRGALAGRAGVACFSDCGCRFKRRPGSIAVAGFRQRQLSSGGP